jgi:hypothetical protein
VISDHGLSIWDRRDPQHPRELANFTGIVTDPTNGPNLTISPDGRLIAAGDLFIGGQGGRAQVWDTRAHKQLPKTFPGAIGVLASDGVTLPFGYGGDTVLMNAETGQLEATVRNTGGDPLAILSPDRHRIAVSEQVGTASVVTVYDLETMRPVGAPLRLHGTTPYPVGFLPDGRLVTTSRTEAAIWTLGKKLPPLAPIGENPLLWNISPADWVQTACTIAGRNLTRSEWRQYLPGRPYRSTCAQWPPAP